MTSNTLILFKFSSFCMYKNTDMVNAYLDGCSIKLMMIDCHLQLSNCREHTTTSLLSSVDKCACSEEIENLPVSLSGLKEEPEGVTDDTLVERVTHLWQFFEVLDSVARGLLPCCLSCQHEVAVIQEEETNDDGGQKGGDQAAKEKQVSLKPFRLPQ